MVENGKPKISEPLPESCPYLALSEDPETFSSFPSKWNACYHSKPVSTPTLRHQRDFCLNEDHVNCLLYQTSKEIKMPKEMQNKTRGLSRQTKSILRIFFWGIIILLVVLAVIFGSRWLSNPFMISPENSTPTGEISVLMTDNIIIHNETQVIIPINTNTEVPQDTPTPSIAIPTATPTIMPTSPPLALDTPFGPESVFVIHRVIAGESLWLFANWYRSSPDAIQAINPDLTYPIQVGDLVVIPIGMTDVSGLPEFEVYEILDASVSLQAIADRFEVSIDDLCFYNNLDENRILHSGDWIIVPLQTTNP